ncbi:MAG: hypothetical protein ACK5JT_09745 [Hyphomicrobiaceae bacterium]
MATILKFRCERRDVGGKKKASNRQPAEIIIFPGARYERWEQSRSQPKCDVYSRSVARDFLVLVD